MQEFKPEGAFTSADKLTLNELYSAMENKKILQSTALAFDTSRQLRFDFGFAKGVMPFAECADGAQNGQVRDIAILTRVGRATCFVIQNIEKDANGIILCTLSRTAAQLQCKEEWLDNVVAGEILPCSVTHIETFGAFCDIGCGISALLPIDCMSVSRISSPFDRVQVGQTLYCVVKNKDLHGRFVLSLRELLGTWEQNASNFNVGETVVGIVRSVEEYGTFIELTPNLAGLAESTPGLRAGQAVSVYIKNILHDKMKMKLVIVNKHLEQTLRFELHYTQTSGHIGHWLYSTPKSGKKIESNFEFATI